MKYFRSNSHGLPGYVGQLGYVCTTRKVKCWPRLAKYLHQKEHRILGEQIQDQDTLECDFCSSHSTESCYERKADGDYSDEEAHGCTSDAGKISYIHVLYVYLYMRYLTGCFIDSERMELFTEGEPRSPRGEGVRKSGAQQLHEIVQEALPRDESDVDREVVNRGLHHLFHIRGYEQLKTTYLTVQKINFCDKDWDSIMELLPDEDPKCYSIYQSIKWVLRILEHNNIDPKKFCTDVYQIMNKVLPKKNCLMVIGAPQAGKTYLLSSIAKSAIYYSTVQSLTGKSAFELQDMLDSRCALINEPLITDNTFETMKNVLEGQPVTIDKKFKAGSTLHRTPCFVATNFNLCNYTTHRAANKQALEARTTHYTFNTFPDLVDAILPLNPKCWYSLIRHYVHLDVPGLYDDLF